MTKPPIDHFGLLAAFYEKVIHTPDLTCLLELLELQPGQKVLDVGGGTGRITQGLRASGPALYIVDPSFGMLRQARAKGCCSTYQGLSESLPFADNVFNRVLAVDSFHHFWDQSLASRELWRVLARGGRLVIEEPDIRRPQVKLVALFEHLALMRSHFYRPEKLAALFVRAGVTPHILEGDFTYWVIVEK